MGGDDGSARGGRFAPRARMSGRFPFLLSHGARLRLAAAVLGGTSTSCTAADSLGVARGSQARAAVGGAVEAESQEQRAGVAALADQGRLRTRGADDARDAVRRHPRRGAP